MTHPSTVVVATERLGHLTAVPVEIAGRSERFRVDSGIGLTIVSPTLAAALGAEPTGERLTGRRMSGQRVEAPLVRLPDLWLGALRIPGPLAASVDLGDGFAGILGPDVFIDTWWSVDTLAGTLTVGAGADRPREVGDAVVPLDVRREGSALELFATLVLPSGRKVTVEVDTGSGALILDTRFIAEFGLAPEEVEVTTGTDETGHEWVRRWADIPGEFHLVAAPETAQRRPRVMFQDIIYDGLIGADYLDRFRYTVDLPRSELILTPLSRAERLSGGWR